jgi:hypothetical protein
VCVTVCVSLLVCVCVCVCVTVSVCHCVCVCVSACDLHCKMFEQMYNGEGVCVGLCAHVHVPNLPELTEIL